MARTIQFVRETAAWRTLRTVARKALRTSRRPAELVEWVGDALLALRGLPVDNKDLQAIWNVPRPRISRKACGCGAATCRVTTLTRWLRNQREWVIVHKHHGGLVGREAQCPKREGCEGHHDEDFKPSDWKSVMSNKVLNEARWHAIGSFGYQCA